MNQQQLITSPISLTSIVQQIERCYCKNNVPKVLVGDTIKIGSLVREGTKERTQYYEGVIIRQTNTSVNKTVTVRRTIQGVGVEKSFLINSPKLTNFEVKKSSRVRQARLYYLRKLSGKATRLKQRFT